MPTVARLKSAKSTSPPTISPADLKARRKKLLSKLGPDSVAILVSNPEATRSNDTQFKYRQSSNLIYLCGFPEPESALVLCNIAGEPEYSLFVRPKDRLKEIWTGIRAGVEGAKTDYHCDAAYTNDQFAEIAGKLLTKAARVYFRFGHNPDYDDQFGSVWQHTQKPLLNPEDIVNEMRLFKDTDEVAVMRHAAQLSASAHCLAMRACRPGLYEYQLASIIEASYSYYGANAPAYGSIVAGGNNAVVLHYESNSAKLQDGQLVLIDAASEYLGYASDITRTFPVNGKFSETQREIYELVLKAQIAAVESAKPGVKLADVHDLASSILAEGLVKLKILPASTRKGADAPSIKWFFVHGTSHWLGIDVHDVGDYRSADGTRSDQGSGKQRILEPGMAITIEPGLYFHADDERVPKPYRGMGIRIEDDVVIMEKGNEVLTGGVPKAVHDIEKLMSEHISFDQWF